MYIYAHIIKLCLSSKDVNEIRIIIEFAIKEDVATWEKGSRKILQSCCDQITFQEDKDEAITEVTQ